MAEIDVLYDVLGHYDLGTENKYIEDYGDGHINDTYKVKYELDDGTFKRYILQRVNTDIFTDYKGLMSNIEKVTSYISKMTPIDENDNTQTLSIVYTKEGSSYVKTSGDVFRVYEFIEDSVSHSFADDLNVLYEAGYAFGMFQKKLQDFDASSLVDTIPRFHDTRNRYEQLKEAVANDRVGRLKKCKAEVDFAFEREYLAGKILDGLASGDIKLRVTHNDTKINNVLMDKKTDKAKCVIDLDTVMAGSVLYDYGDAIRSCGSTLIEDAKNIEDQKVNFDNFKSYTEGFLDAIGDSLTEKEIEMLPISAVIMTLECAIRFLTDYLNGDTYFKVAYDDHNLIRTKNQFKYIEELEKNYNELVNVINYIYSRRKL